MFMFSLLITTVFISLSITHIQFLGHIIGHPKMKSLGRREYEVLSPNSKMLTNEVS